MLLHTESSARKVFFDSKEKNLIASAVSEALLAKANKEF